MNPFNVCKPGLEPAKHVNYVYGMVLGVDDFTQEFTYLTNRDQWLTRDLIGYGTVSGLKVFVDGPKVHVSSGVAINVRGQLILVKTDQCANIEKWVLENQTKITDLGPPPKLIVYVVLNYKECETDDVPIPGEPCRSQEYLLKPSRIADGFELELVFDKPGQTEEDAIRGFVKWLRKTIKISSDQGSISDIGVFETEFRNTIAVLEPLSQFPLSDPPKQLNIDPSIKDDYLPSALRIWVTDIRPKIRPDFLMDSCGCDGEDEKSESLTNTVNEAVLLAELEIPISNGEINGNIKIIEKDRPFTLNVRLVQELTMFLR